MRQIYNPYLPLDEYISDGEPHVFGERIYLFGSHDKEGGNTFCMLEYTVYSAPVTDIKDWKCEGIIYCSRQDPNASEKRKYLYAPDVVRGNDGRYYLYYFLSGFGGKGGFEGPISVAVCDNPAGKYEYYGDVKNPDGSKFTRMIPFDPAVINDDGVIRMYYGWALPVSKPKSKLEAAIITKVMQGMFSKRKEEITSEPEGIMGANTVVLADDMLTVMSEPKRIIPPQMMATETCFDGHSFFEASSIRKIGDTYYFIYSSNLNHELCYARSKYPDKGFVYGGTIVSSGDIGYHGRLERDRLNGTSNNHGSIECVNGKWYVFYHRHTHNTTYSRQACAEPIIIREDGSIPQVEITSCGLNGGPLEAKGEYPAVIACNLTDGKMPHIRNGQTRAKKPYIKHSENERFITGIKQGVLIGYKYFDFKGTTKVSVRTRGKGKGKLIISTEIAGKTLGEMKINPSAAWHDSMTEIEVAGIKPLYFKLEGKGSLDFISFTLSR